MRPIPFGVEEPKLKLTFTIHFTVFIVLHFFWGTKEKRLNLVEVWRKGEHLEYCVRGEWKSREGKSRSWLKQLPYWTDSDASSKCSSIVSSRPSSLNAVVWLLLSSIYPWALAESNTPSEWMSKGIEANIILIY